MLEPASNISGSAARRNLQRLNTIRCVAIGSQFLVLYYLWIVRDIGLPGTILTTILLIYSAVLAISSWRSHWRQPITELEFFGHLLVDIVFFTALLYFSGGASNPFIPYYLVPICIAAATLPRGYSWIVALISLAAYSWLTQYNHPVLALSPNRSHHNEGGINLHLVGMWANFIISAGLITFFVTKMAFELRQQEAAANQLREHELRNNQVLAVATLAAGTAHELGTPLNTMQILLDEMAHHENNPDTEADIQTLQTQVQQCRATLQQLVATAQLSSDTEQPPKDVRCYFEELLDNWQVIRPDAKPNIRIDSHCPQRTIYFPPTVAQSLQNLLNNAVDASRKVDIHIAWDDINAQITIRDYGPGISPELAEQLGHSFVSSQTGGLGLGLLLTRTTLNRIGGKVVMSNANDGGTVTQVTLPIASEHYD